MDYKIKKGLNLPISGELSETLDANKESTKVAVIGADFIGMKPTMQVKVGDEVKVGQVLFSCKKNIGLTFTAPSAGKILEINRGERRVFQSVVIGVSSKQESVTFKSYEKKSLASYTSEEVKRLLLESGEWKSLRQRPFDKVASVTETPSSLFITATDTNPLAPKPDFIIKQYSEEFAAGVEVLSKLPKGKTYVCKEKGVSLPDISGVETANFSGPHPAGNVGTHIHFIDPVNPGKIAWHIGYQDVIAVGKLFLTGELHTDKVISIGGPKVKSPRYLRVQKGACLSELLEGELKEGDLRVISGSVLHGRKASGAFDYLGSYANQVTALEEDNSRELLGWHSPGFNKFSVKNIYVSKLFPKKKFNFGTSKNGSYRAMVPVGSFEKVMPLDILPTQLLRALVSKDTDLAQDLGCLELAEEDLALLTFVSPGKVDFGPHLREILTVIEKEG